MRPRTIFILGLAALLAYAFYRLFFQRPPDALDAHLAEQQEKSKIGRIVSAVMEIIRPPTQTYSNRGPLDGAIVTPWDEWTATQPTIFRPTIDAYDGGSIWTRGTIFN